MNISQIETSVSKVSKLTADLTASLKRPSSRTLKLIDKALSYLLPFESPKAKAASAYERQELLALLDAHRMTLSPYLDIDSVKRHLA